MRCCVLRVGWGVLCVCCCFASLRVACCMLRVTCKLLRLVWCSLVFVVDCLPFVTLFVFAVLLLVARCYSCVRCRLMYCSLWCVRSGLFGAVCWLLCMGVVYCLLVVDWWLFMLYDLVVCCVLMLFVVCCSCTVCCVLAVACRLSSGVRCSLFVARWSLFVVCSLLCVMC